jgi:X-X-X-Leu-X-X-Gly heptad repeat protein
MAQANAGLGQANAGLRQANAGLGQANAGLGQANAGLRQAATNSGSIMEGSVVKYYDGEDMDGWIEYY